MKYQAENWEKHHKNFGFSKLEKLYCQNSITIIKQINPKSILDIGCCTGDYIFQLRKDGIESKYLGIDITPSFIDICQKRMPKERFKIGNIFDLKFKTKFDYVLCQNILMHLDNLVLAIENIVSVSSKYIFLSFYGTKEKTMSFHTQEFLNFVFNKNDIVKLFPNNFFIENEWYFENEYPGISIVQLLLRKK